MLELYLRRLHRLLYVVSSLGSGAYGGGCTRLACSLSSPLCPSLPKAIPGKRQQRAPEGYAGEGGRDAATVAGDVNVGADARTMQYENVNDPFFWRDCQKTGVLKGRLMMKSPAHAHSGRGMTSWAWNKHKKYLNKTVGDRGHV